MRAAVLSGTGFIGRPTLAALLEEGAEVSVATRTGSSPVPGVEPILADRGDWPALVQAVMAWKPDVVLDYRPMTRNDGRRLREAFDGHVSRIVAISSADVYMARDRVVRDDPGEPIPSPMTEDAPLRRVLFPYAKPKPSLEEGGDTYEKILMEQEVLACTESTAAVVRLPMVYGPGDRQTRTAEYLSRMRAGRPCIVLAENFAGWRGPRGYVDDMGRCAALCCLSSHTGAFHCCEEPSAEEREWLQRIAAAAGWSGEVVEAPEEDLPESLRHGLDTRQHWSFDCSKARTLLGWNLRVSLDEAMSRTIAWQDTAMPDKDYSAEWEAEDQFIASRQA